MCVAAGVITGAEKVAIIAQWTTTNERSYDGKPLEMLSRTLVCLGRDPGGVQGPGSGW